MAKAAILFDMDGVTINTEPLYTNAEIKLFKEYGVNIPKKDFSLFRGSSEECFYALSMEKYNINENKALFIKKGRKYVQQEFLHNIPFICGFKKFHSKISKYYDTGLVTAAPRSTLNFISKKLNLEKYFSYMISGEETVRNKPYPDPYIQMMKNIGVEPNNTIIIEDSITGIRSGLSSGAHVIAKTGSMPKRQLKIAHKVIADYQEITLEYISNILRNTN